MEKAHPQMESYQLKVIWLILQLVQLVLWQDGQCRLLLKRHAPSGIFMNISNS